MLGDALATEKTTALGTTGHCLAIFVIETTLPDEIIHYINLIVMNFELWELIGRIEFSG